VKLALPIDHIRARQHRGTDDADNLALAFGHCNAKKGPNLTGVDPASGGITPLFVLIRPTRQQGAPQLVFGDATADAVGYRLSAKFAGRGVTAREHRQAFPLLGGLGVLAVNVIVSCRVALAQMGPSTSAAAEVAESRYCRPPQSASSTTFPIDHVIARQHDGTDAVENLALSCPA
jgi:hypothetical protein